jgi:hypothetical protein
MNRNKPLSETCRCNGCNNPTAWNLRVEYKYNLPEKCVYNNAYCSAHFAIAEEMLHIETERINGIAKSFKGTVMLIRVKK